MSTNKRAVRRHHQERLKKRRKHYWGYDSTGIRPNNMDEKQLGLVANTPCPCSCFGCGNPRKHFKELTKAERIASLKFTEQCKEVERCL